MNGVPYNAGPTEQVISQVAVVWHGVVTAGCDHSVFGLGMNRLSSHGKECGETAIGTKAMGYVAG